MATIFSKIANGEIPSYRIAEDDRFFAILDINPLTRGHALVIPRKEVDYLFDLDEETYAGLFKFSKKVARGIETAITCKRVGMLVYGMDVPHVHIHLVPLHGGGNEFNFSKPPVKLSPEEFENIAARIRESIQAGQ